MTSTLKFIILLALVAVVAVVHAEFEEDQFQSTIFVAEPSNDLILGRREKGDKLVVTEAVKSGSKLGRKVIVKKTFNVGNKEITYIKAMDRSSKKGGSVELVSGGLGQDSVTLRFKSPRSKGINFQVKVYAKASSGGGSSGGKESSETEEED